MKVIEDPKYIRRLFWLCWIGYVAALLGRFNYAAVMAEMIYSEHISMAQAGLVLTAFFAAYGIGQPICGVMGDKFSAKKLHLLGFILSITANILMGLRPSAQAMIFIWFFNGFSQAMLWPATVKLLSGNLSYLQSKKAMINIAPSVPIGTILTYLTTSVTITFLSWRAVFFIAASVMCVTAVLCYFGFGSLEKHLATYGRYVSSSKDNVYKKTSFLNLFISSGLVFTAMAVIMQGALRDGITTWAPALIDAHLNLELTWAVLITSAIPLFGVLGAYGAFFINRKWLRNEIKTSALLFGIAATLLIVLAAGAGGISFLLAIIIAGGVMHGVNTMLISLVPLHFAKAGKASTMTGVMNFFTYVGSGLSGAGIGILTANFGWVIAIGLWSVLAGIGLIVCLLCAKKWNRFVEAN